MNSENQKEVNRMADLFFELTSFILAIAEQ
jgi:hypothetical protein